MMKNRTGDSRKTTAQFRKRNELQKIRSSQSIRFELKQDECFRLEISELTSFTTLSHALV